MGAKEYEVPTERCVGFITASKHIRHFIASETPFFVGRAVAALASEYGFTDMDGSRPDLGKYFEGDVLNQN